jgi:hypothetical protein
MDLRRVRVWEWLTGLAGAALLASLFLPWYGEGGRSLTGWESFAVIDVVLAVAALLAIALPAVAAAQRTAAVPQALTALVLLVGYPAIVLVAIRLLNIPGDDLGREAGVFAAALSLIALLYVDSRSMGDRSFPRAMRPRLDVAVIPAPTADGERRDLT